MVALLENVLGFILAIFFKRTKELVSLVSDLSNLGERVDLVHKYVVVVTINVECVARYIIRE
jgi:hypothetical protein